MTEITGLTADANQSQNLILPDGSSAPLTLTYMDNQQGWFISLSYPGWSGCTNRRLVVNPNMLRAFRSIIPFGLALSTTDGYEPIFITDFISGRASLFLLNADDVQNYENILTQDYLLVNNP
jgi:hypothetical protein